MSIHIHLRRLRRSRVFAVTAVGILGLGLGVNLILFNTAHALLWRPLNFPQPDRLVTLPDRVTGAQSWAMHALPDVVGETGLAGRNQLVALLQNGDSLEMPSATVDSGYFRALGLRPVAGQLFGNTDDHGGGGEQAAVLTETAWRARFGSDYAVIGRPFLIQGGGQKRQARIVGVVAGGATLPFVADAEILFPLASASEGVRLNDGDALYRCVLRLQPRATVAEATARLGPIQPLRDALAPVDGRMILYLYGAALLLLTLTVFNVASLFVARSTARAHELGVHVALGASQWQILRTHLAEALLVCTAGTAFAFAIEASARPVVPILIPAITRIGPELLAPSLVLLAFGGLLCIVAALFISAAATFRAGTAGIAAALARGGRASGPSGTGRFRAVLASAQLSIVLALLTLAAMTGRSFLAALNAGPGLDPSGVMTFQASIPRGHGSASDLADRVAAIPGMTAVTYAAELPVGVPAFSTITAPHAGDLKPGDPMLAYRLIGPSYFTTLRIPMQAGRAFSLDDAAYNRQVAILSESAAKVLFPGESPLGRTIRSGFMDRRSTVIGVARDFRSEGLDRPAVPQVFLPYLPGWGLRIIARTDGDANTLAPLVRSRVRMADAAVVLLRFRPLSELLDSTIRERKSAGALTGGLAIIGLIVSCVGLYGTLAAQVQQRRREIGVRIALGSPARAILLTVLRDAVRIVAWGSVAGLASSAAVARVIRTQLYGISADDPASFLTALGLLSIAALAACLIPAVSATRVDPVQTLNAQ